MIQPLIDAVENSFLLAEKVFDKKFKRCEIKFDIRPTSNIAGQAQLLKRRIRFNRHLYRLYPSKITTVIVPHEVAHVVAFDLYGPKAANHGPLWKHVMIRMGQKPIRCHSLMTSNSERKPVYECQKCKKQTIAQTKLHRLIQNGFAETDFCHCGGDYMFVGRVIDLVKNKTLSVLEMPERI